MKLKHWYLLFLAFVLAAVPLAVAPAHADEEQDRIRAVEAGRRSVVSLRVYRAGRSKPGVGSGIILRSDGFILTNAHVVEGAKVIKVGLPGGKQYTGKLWKDAPDKDLALIKIEATGLPVARPGNSDNVKLGQTAIAIGDPLGFSGTITVGTVSGVHRDIKLGQLTYAGMIQTDAAINPGSSGGALINLDGEVIGVNTLIYTGTGRGAQGLGFAIPIKHALNVAKTLVAARPATQGRPWVGISGENLNADLAATHNIPAKRGIIVTQVLPGSPAEASNMMVGDAIVQVNGKTVLNKADFLLQINKYKPGDTINLAIWRQGKKASIPLTLDVSSQ